MHAHPTGDARLRIHRDAAAAAEARVYSLGNPYLSPTEKAQIEAVFQFPLGAFAYTFAVTALAFHQPLGTAYAIAAVVSLGAWITARFFPSPSHYYFCFPFGGLFATVISIGFAMWAFAENNWWVGGFMMANALGIAVIAMPPFYLWTLTCRLHPKYEIAKRMFRITFPFESDLPT